MGADRQTGKNFWKRFGEQFAKGLARPPGFALPGDDRTSAPIRIWDPRLRRDSVGTTTETLSVIYSIAHAICPRRPCHARGVQGSQTTEHNYRVEDPTAIDDVEHNPTVPTNLP